MSSVATSPKKDVHGTTAIVGGLYVESMLPGDLVSLQGVHDLGETCSVSDDPILKSFPRTLRE